MVVVVSVQGFVQGIQHNYCIHSLCHRWLEVVEPELGGGSWVIKPHVIVRTTAIATDLLVVVVCSCSGGKVPVLSSAW